MSLAGQDIESRHYIQSAPSVKGQSYRNRELKSIRWGENNSFFIVDNSGGYPQSAAEAVNATARPPSGPGGASQKSTDLVYRVL